MKVLKTPIQSDMIPHEKFHRGKWMKSRGCDWYHFVPCRVSHNYIEDSTFYDTLDSQLVDLVKHLHGNGTITTPSCTGHFLSEEECKARFDQLKKEEAKIKKGVLLLEDSETNIQYLYKDPHYTLPYNEEDFVEKLQDYGRKGVLGIKDFPVDTLNILDIPCLTVKKDKDITLLLTEPKTEEELVGTWSTLYEVIAGVLSEKKDVHKAMNPGILSSKSQLKGEDGKIKISKVRKELSKQKDKNSTYSKALKRSINYHDDK